MRLRNEPQAAEMVSVSAFKREGLLCPSRTSMLICLILMKLPPAGPRGAFIVIGRDIGIEYSGSIAGRIAPTADTHREREE